MKIGIIGAGNIGATLARKLVASGHEVKLANSKGPDTKPWTDVSIVSMSFDAWGRLP